MQEHIQNVEHPKTVLRAGQHVWAKNKYLVLACSQADYVAIRQALRPDCANLHVAYNRFLTVQNTYQKIQTKDLPELQNALFHIAGYFKRYLSQSKRQALHELILTDREKALATLHMYTNTYKEAYLMASRFWDIDRDTPFNSVDASIVKAHTLPNQCSIKWKGSYIEIIK